MDRTVVKNGLRYIRVEDVPDPPPDDVFAKEWAVYKRELPRLLAEGHEGKFVLIKGDALIGVWGDRYEALREGYARFGVVDLYTEEISPLLRVCRIPRYY